MRKNSHPNSLEGSTGAAQVTGTVYEKELHEKSIFHMTGLKRGQDVTERNKSKKVRHTRTELWAMVH